MKHTMLTPAAHRLLELLTPEPCFVSQKLSPTTKDLEFQIAARELVRYGFAYDTSSGLALTPKGVRESGRFELRN